MRNRRAIIAYLRRGDRSLQEHYLEILKSIRWMCPDCEIKLFYHVGDEERLTDLEDVKMISISSVPSGENKASSELFMDKTAQDSPAVLLQGPGMVEDILKRRFASVSSADAFSTHLRLLGGAKGRESESVFTLIHADPNPTEPNLDPTFDPLDHTVFTGFAVKESEARDCVFPIHGQGAEVTARLVKNLLSGRPISSGAFLYPTVAMIEPTRRCNLACPLCPVGGNRIHAVQDMPLERFRILVDELKPFVIRLFLHNYGEPFLRKDLYSMISYTKQAGIPDVEISTNGHVLDASALVASGLDEIKISLDGITQGTYAHYRRGGQLHRVIANIRSLVEEKRKRRSAKPLLELQFIIMKHNQNEMDGFRTLATELGAERIRFKTFNLHMSGPEASPVGVEFLPTHPEHTRYEDDGGFMLKKRLEASRCKWPWAWTVINTDGHVVPCCNDFEGHHSMGNVFLQSFHDIWFGEKYNQFRENILERWRDIPMCAQCPVPSLDDLSVERVETTRHAIKG